MVYREDTTQTFTITLVGFLEGFGSIINMKISNLTSGIDYVWNGTTWTPGLPEAIEADSIRVEAVVANQGDATDTIFGQFSSAQVTPGEALIQESVQAINFFFTARWTFTMPPNSVNITINAGHVE